MNTKPALTFVRILIPFILGILSFYKVTDSIVSIWTSSVCVALLCYLLWVNMYYKNLRAYRFKGIIGSAMLLFFFALGGICCMLNNQQLKASHLGKNKGKYLHVCINEEPQQKKGILRFRAKAIAYYTDFQESAAVSGNLMAAIKLDTLKPIDLQYGDELIIAGICTEIEPPYNPGEFDYRSWLAAQNIYHQIFIRQQQVMLIRQNRGNPIIAYALKLRAQQLAFYRKVLKSEAAFTFAATLILGSRADLSIETIDIYAKTGTIHALSVSGMHVGLVYLVLNKMLIGLDRKRWLKPVKVVVILAAIWFYALLTGLSPSVLRSVIMLSVVIIAKSLSRNTNSYNVIAFAAFGLLLYNPFLVWDVGFQLSFLAVIGLIGLQPAIQNWWHSKQQWLNKIWGAVAMSIAAQLATYPLSVYYFHQFPSYFILSNLFILLPMALLMYGGIFMLLFRIAALGPAFEWLVRFTNNGLALIAELPFSSLRGIWISKSQLALLCLALFLFILACKGFKKWCLFSSLICFACLQLWISYNKIQSSTQQKIIVFKLRKHHASAFLFGNNAVLISDLDAQDKDFKHFVQPALDLHNIKKITYKYQLRSP